MRPTEQQAVRMAPARRVHGCKLLAGQRPRDGLPPKARGCQPQRRLRPCCPSGTDAAAHLLAPVPGLLPRPQLLVAGA